MGRLSLVRSARSFWPLVADCQVPGASAESIVRHTLLVQEGTSSLVFGSVEVLSVPALADGAHDTSVELASCRVR